jgi:hypothetical protein
MGLPEYKDRNQETTIQYNTTRARTHTHTHTHMLNSATGTDVRLSQARISFCINSFQVSFRNTVATARAGKAEHPSKFNYFSLWLFVFNST